MGKNDTTDRQIVQKVFDMRSSGDSKSNIGRFFHHSRQWIDHILKTYSSETFPPIVVNQRGVKRKTLEHEDSIIVQKARENFRFLVRRILAELKFPQQNCTPPLLKTDISRQTVDRQLREAGARTVSACSHQN